MCTTCGCASTLGTRRRDEPPDALPHRGAGRTSVEVLAGLLDGNDRQARQNRLELERYGILAVNLMSAPGSGKTALLEATIEALGARHRIAVIEGDLATENDAARIRAKGVPAVQITTGQACHLDAQMVHDAMHELDLAAVDVLFIENVGNLVCPASFDLGHHLNAVLLSVTEGDDKPAKYPVMFRHADIVLVTKADLLGAIDDFDVERATQHVRALANPAPVIAISSRKRDKLADWLGWLEAQRGRRQIGLVQRPRIERDAALPAGGGIS